MHTWQTLTVEKQYTKKSEPLYFKAEMKSIFILSPLNATKFKNALGHVHEFNELQI